MKHRERVCPQCGRVFRDKREHAKTCPLSDRATRRQFEADWDRLRPNAKPSVLDDPAVQQADRERWDRAKAAEERRAL